MELFNVDLGLIFWMFVAFAILFVILWRWGWPAIMKGVNSRADLIDQGVEYARQAKEQLDNANAQAREILDQARRQQADQLREADKMKTQIIDEARTAAQAAAKKEAETARQAIEQERKQAEQQLKSQVASYALQIAGQVVRAELADPKAQQQLAGRLLDQMEADKK